MIVTYSESVVYFDVDGTLIVDATHLPEHRHVNVYDPIEDKIIKFRVHEPMVRLLKEEHHRGSYVVVWSRGGHAWAESVVRALGLEPCVHQVMSKPTAYFDDVLIEDWLKYRVFLPPDMQYKK